MNVKRDRKVKRRGRTTTFLCQCDPVVLQKDDFQAVANHGVVVDHLADGCDQADDHLGCVVPRSSLRGRRVKAGDQMGSITAASRGCGKSPTFPPIMIVLGVHCLFGSFLMPAMRRATVTER